MGFGRAVARYFASLLSAALLLIGFIMIGLRRDKRGLHDLICDTVVLRR
ncbi:MAG: RDD family protein [Chloroflexi bacterium]|nr:RDD family protein [Chloroflexota bacterium]